MRVPQVRLAGGRLTLLTCCAVMLAQPALATVLCVPDVAVDGSCVSGHATIQTAVTAAANGDTILVGPGTFADFIVNKSLTIKGAKAGIGACGRDGSGETVVTAATRLVELQNGSAGTIIDGFTFSGDSKQIESTSGPIDGVQILNNRFLEFTGSAIFLNDNGSDITIDANLIDGTSQISGGALHLDQDAFDGMQITNNCIRDGATGIFSDGVRNVGVSASGRRPLMRGNLITGNVTGANLGRKSWEFCDILDNRFQASDFDGLQGGPADCTIRGNFFAGNGRHGLALTGFGGATDPTRGAQRNLVSLNCVNGNGETGVLFSSSQFAGTQGSNFVNSNNIFGNLDASADGSGAFYSGADTIDATLNWWGAADGPSGDGPGSGDSINGTTGGGSITFAPFVVAPLVLGAENCDNGLDDDCDGLIDGADPDCFGACCTNGPGTHSDCIETSQVDCEGNGGLYLGNATACANVDDCEALAVTIDSFTATASPDGVIVRWSTAMEVDTVGFRVLRESPGREKGRVAVSGLIPSAGDNLAGASYEFVDRARFDTGSARYYLEDVDRWGRSTLHGPVTVDVEDRSQRRTADVN